MKFTLAQLDAKVSLRKPGYKDAVLKESRKTLTGDYEIDDGVLHELVGQYSIKTKVFTEEQIRKILVTKTKEYAEVFFARSVKRDNNYEISILELEEIESKYGNPAVLEMIRNLTQAAAEAMKKGWDTRPPEEVERLLTICVECPKYVEKGPRCGKCGCFLSAKTALKTWHCPLKKW